VLAADLLQPEMISALYTTYRDDLVVDSGLTIAELIELAGRIRDVNTDDIRSYQIEATGTIIGGAAVLVWDQDSTHMRAILDIFRGAAESSPANPDAGPGAATPPPAQAAPAPNAPRSAIVPDPTVNC
jgi:hypothetical protein